MWLGRVLPLHLSPHLSLCWIYSITRVFPLCGRWWGWAEGMSREEVTCLADNKNFYHLSYCLMNLAGLCAWFLGESLWTPGISWVKRVSRQFTVGCLDHTWVYTDEVTHAQPLDSFRMGAGHAGKANCVIRRFALWARRFLFNFLWRGVGRWRAEKSGDWVQSHGQVSHQLYLQSETPIKSTGNHTCWIDTS